jgi:hypothetical protein
MTPEEKQIYKAWLHYRNIGDEKRKMETMHQMVELIKKRGT